MALVKHDKNKLAIARSSENNVNVGTTKKNVKVLDEDTYVQSLDKIIQRDFFPEIPKLRAQHEYLDAVENNDTERLREISVRYQASQTPVQPGERLATPATFDTPSTVQGTPAPQYSGERNVSGVKQDGKEPKQQEVDDLELSLDKFLSKNVSEDNASFEAIMEVSAEKHREKYAWLYDKEIEQKETKEKLLALPASLEGDQFKDEPRPAMVETWNYRNKNMLMYCPDGVDLSVQEKIEGKNEKRQEVSHLNTRFRHDPFPDTSCTDQLAEAAATLNAAKHGKIGVDGRLQGSSETPRVAGFGFVATPSPAPGVDASPLMTWGSIEGTPFRLDGGDTPVQASPGPAFKMPAPKKRDELARSLVEKVSKKHREKKREAAARAVAMIGQSPKHMNTMERLTQLSPAAQRLASNKLGIRTGTDKALSASYTPSPSRLGGSTPSYTPRTGLTPRTPNVKGSTPSRTTLLSDNLLNLPKHNT